jgi:ribose transport system ATP-binding protein
VSSELPEVLALASTVLVLAKGRPSLYRQNQGLAEEEVLAAAFAHG